MSHRLSPSECMKAFLTLFTAVLLPDILAAAEPVDYARDIQPVLTKHCTSCHGAKKQRSNLRLDSVAAARLGGDSGPALVPGKSADSRLIQARHRRRRCRRHAAQGTAPRRAQIALLRAWIDGGAAIPAR